MRFVLIAGVFTLAVFGFFGVSSLSESRAESEQTVQANDNRLAAGRLTGSVLHVALDARIAIWHPDGDDGPGIPIQTFSEAGKAPQIPGPLIRVPAGTTVIASVQNSIPATTLTIHGMVDRPAVRDRPTRVPYGKTSVIRFRAGSPGTYLYWGATAGETIGRHFGSDSQLTGAFIVDPKGASPIPNDRIFVVGQWINVRDKRGSPNFNYELDVINGRTWPHTERLSYAQNSTVHWRLVNGSAGGHPLHLHGFYFTVTSRGDGIIDNTYANDADRDREVTELIEPGSTFTMTWHADRPGNWLFHCHLTYHTIGHVPIAAMLTGKSSITDEAYEGDFVRHAGMGGLILAFTVRDPKPHKVVAPAAVARHIQLTVERAKDDRPDAPSFRYVLGDDADAAQTQPGAIGPPIVLTRGVPYAIDVTNRLNEPTAVHWHGIEVADSYNDGVAGYSGYGRHLAPMIDPGQTFEALITPPRAGTFIYHTHMDDIWQLRGGLAGPLIVMEPGKTFDPSSDHVFTITTTHKFTDALKIFVNGTFSPAAVTCRVGIKQRFRLINMTTFWTNAIVSLNAANRTARWSPLQMDGMYLPNKRRTPESAVAMVSIGETRDFTFTPTTPGDLQLQFWPDAAVPNIVTVPIHVVQ